MFEIYFSEKCISTSYKNNGGIIICFVPNDVFRN